LNRGEEAQLGPPPASVKRPFAEFGPDQDQMA
jgi:hypothetical protein